MSINNNGLNYYTYQPANGCGGEAGVVIEPMFEKQLTPSDVGKLNRLVIPKQHAERFFPLSSSSSSCTSSSTSPDPNSSSDRVDGANGTLLGFMDETGKAWRFRYSYWRSSQSYVLTKGWSRYVKEKGLKSGDVVFFARRGPPGMLNGGEERFFIGWRRRGGEEDGRHGVATARGWTDGGSGRAHDMMQTYPEQYGHGPILPYRDQNHNYIHPDCIGVDPNHNHGYSQTHNSSRKVRLFGVNLECCLPTDDALMTSPNPPLLFP